MDELENFYTALDAAVERAGNMNRLSRLSGIPVNSLTRWVKRERTPTLESLIPLLPFIDWPTRRASPVATMERIGNGTAVEEVAGDDLKSIPVYLEAGAGAPVDVWDEDPIRKIDVLPRYWSENVRAVEVVGDSMEPTIMKGAIVGVKPFDGNLREGGIYLCRVPYFGLLVKRVRANGMRGMVLISDNPSYPPTEVPFEDCPELIVGEVTWCWQEV